MRSSPSHGKQPTSSPRTYFELMVKAGAARPRLGIIVNPLAGIGGPAALKGSDGAATVAEARARGARPEAPLRAERTLQALAARVGPAELLAAPGAMGADLARRVGFSVKATSRSAPSETSALDTRVAATAMRDADVGLLLFAGGDGTARDIHDAIGDQLPLLGIPAGVKMHSGVFAHSPEAAARAAEAALRNGPSLPLRGADIADVDEQAARDGRVASILYGSVRVPDLPRLVLPTKAGSPAQPGAELQALCREIADTLEPSCLYLFGPGSTTAMVLAALGARGTLLGVDAVLDGRVVGKDLTESQTLALLDTHLDSRLVVGLVGGQGMLFGRGNRQLTAAVLSRVGADRITVLSAADKLLALTPPTLWVDTGDPVLDKHLSGYIRVRVGPRQQIIMTVSS